MKIDQTSPQSIDTPTKKDLPKYKILEKLGEGSYSTVYRTKNRTSGEFFALKKFENSDDSEGISQDALREISLLKKLNHKNVIKIVEVYNTKKIFAVLPFYKYNLTCIVKREIEFKVADFYNIVIQMFEGVNYLHSVGVIHRDLKPHNVLMNAEPSGFDLCIADFGLSTMKTTNMDNEVCTLWYRPPELLLDCENYGSEIDIWSLGCIVAEMLLGKYFLQGENRNDQLTKIFKVFATNENYLLCLPKKLEDYKDILKFPNTFEEDFKEIVDRDLVKVVEKCCEIDPKKRCSALDILKHLYPKIYKEKNIFSSTDYFPLVKKKLKISGKKRREIINNLFEIKNSGKLSWKTLESAIRNFDIYIREDCSEENILEISVCFLMIASKFYENYHVLDAKDCVKICKNTKENFISLEKNICEKLEFNIYPELFSDTENDQIFLEKNIKKMLDINYTLRDADLKNFESKVSPILPSPIKGHPLFGGSPPARCSTPIKKENSPRTKEVRKNIEKLLDDVKNTNGGYEKSIISGKMYDHIEKNRWFLDLENQKRFREVAHKKLLEFSTQTYGRWIYYKYIHLFEDNVIFEE